MLHITPSVQVIKSCQEVLGLVLPQYFCVSHKFKWRKDVAAMVLPPDVRNEVVGGLILVALGAIAARLRAVYQRVYGVSEATQPLRSQAESSTNEDRDT